MLERYTVESLAGVILSDLKDGRVSPKMLRRFRRQGKRDGRRSRSHVPVQDLIVHAVGVATSKICEEYVNQVENTRFSLATLEADAAQTQSVLSTIEAPPSVAAEASETVRALAEMQNARHVQRVRRLEGHAADLGKQIKGQRDALTGLPSKYRQISKTCTEAGHLLWADYRLGYEKGKRRRVSPEDEVSGPPEGLEFTVPCTFAVAAPVSGGMS
jgi:hypothetical protein